MLLDLMYYVRPIDISTRGTGANAADSRADADPLPSSSFSFWFSLSAFSAARLDSFLKADTNWLINVCRTDSTGNGVDDILSVRDETADQCFPRCFRPPKFVVLIALPATKLF